MNTPVHGHFEPTYSVERRQPRVPELSASSLSVADAAALPSDIRRIAAIGGGHGLGRVLSALAFRGEHVSGIVTTTDNGGSSGRLRQETACIAWGDLRHCMSELIPNPTLATLLFDHRFLTAGALADHALGNLMLLGADQLCARPLDAVNLMRELLGVRAQLIPMSETPCDLVGLAAKQALLEGEVAISHRRTELRSLSLSRRVAATPEALRSLAEADLILLGPGSFFTSVVPPLLISEIRHSLRASAATKLWLPNLTAPLAGDSPTDLTQFRWLQRLLGADTIDGILWPLHRPMPAFFGPRVFAVELAAATDPARHDREKLLTALANALCELRQAEHRAAAQQCSAAPG
jgi:uncharacterized cofD-like protein